METRETVCRHLFPMVVTPFLMVPGRFGFTNISMSAMTHTPRAMMSLLTVLKDKTNSAMEGCWATHFLSGFVLLRQMWSRMSMEKFPLLTECLLHSCSGLQKFSFRWWQSDPARSVQPFLWTSKETPPSHFQDTLISAIYTVGSDCDLYSSLPSTHSNLV